MEIWFKIRRFLLLWAAVFIVLLVAAVIVYREELAALISGSLSSLFGTIVSFGLIIVVLIWLLRAFFRT